MVHGLLKNIFVLFGNAIMMLWVYMSMLELDREYVPLVEKAPMVPVGLGHQSRLPNRDWPIGTNAGPGWATNRDQWLSTWPGLAARGGRLIGPGS